MNLAALKAELLSGHPGPVSNPGVVPYDADDSIAAGQLNDVNRTRNRASMTGSEVLNAIVKSEYTGLATDAERDKVWQVLHLGEINPFGIESDLFVDVFGGGSATIAALQTARVDDVSRAVELGLGFVRPGNVNEARSK